MLKRIYADNYRCLVNFELIAGDPNVLAGQHGSGRASLLLLMEQIQAFLVLEKDYSGPLSDDFWPNTRTAWQDQDVQTFEVECEANGENFLYRLQVSHSGDEDGEDEDEAKVVREELMCEGERLFSFADGTGTLHISDESFTAPDEWSDQSSPLAAVLRVTKNERLRSFRSWWFNTLWTVNTGIDDLRNLEGTAKHPEPHLYNFVPWYRHRAQADPQRVASLDKELASVLPRFTRLELESANLYALFTSPDETPTKIAIDDLAHAERVLIHLYAYLHLALEPGRVLWIAAPKASIAATAIGSWLKRLITRAQETSSQLIVAVNQPEALGDLPPAAVHRFERQHGGRSTVSRDG